VATEIKFCGMTRAADAQAGAALGAEYVGVIFAPGPRRLTTDQAAAVLHDLSDSTRRVGVFDRADATTVADIAKRIALSAVQLHGGCDGATIARLRATFGGEIWAVVRLANVEVPASAGVLFEYADAVVLDTHVRGKLGGTGVALPWRALATKLEPLRGRGAKLVLAGGLRPENVSEAIGLLRPDVVDVSSGVETAPGIKDHTRMRAFRDAVRAIT
jgi:phosphoribosylanthranilate isomerase